MLAAFKRWLRGRQAALDRLLLRLVARSGWLAAAYSVLLLPGYRAEMRGLALGRLQYQQQRQQPSGSSATLRRNIHRLEKALLMRPLRPVFAADYIEPTVEHYARCLSAAHFSASELQWAAGVLSRYFNTVNQPHPVVDRARQHYTGLAEYAPTTGGPYARGERPVPVSLEAFRQLAERRRSVRWFLPTPVPRALLTACFEIGGQAPTACNRQPYRFLVFNQPAEAQQVASHAMGTAGWLQGIPCCVVVVGRRDVFFSSRDRHVPYIDASLCVMQTMLALEAAGLASCPINWPDISRRERALRQHLGLMPSEVIVMLMAVGYADPSGEVARSTKKDAPGVVEFRP